VVCWPSSSCASSSTRRTHSLSGTRHLTESIQNVQTTQTTSTRRLVDINEATGYNGLGTADKLAQAPLDGVKLASAAARRLWMALNSPPAAARGLGMAVKLAPGARGFDVGLP
jgi:hypothetical protein